MAVAGRARAILRAVVEEYVETASPVGSQTIAQREDVAVSSATVRNCLKELESKGHVVQPHVSAGRMPTDLGYRTVVQDLLRQGVMPLELSPLDAPTLEDAPTLLAQVLAALTRCLAVVSAPMTAEAKVVALSLVPTLPGCATLVVVCDDGHVLHRTLPVVMEDGRLAQAQGRLQDLMVGHGLPSEENRADWLAELPEDLTALCAKVLDLIEEGLLRPDGARPARAGMAGLLAQPEFLHGPLLQDVAEVLEDDSRWVQGLLAQPGSGLIVRIGQENGDSRLGAMSVVAKEFKGDQGIGLVACVGPTRMDYPRTIAAVEAVARDAQALYAGPMAS